MVGLIEKALSATRESKHIEFKQEFDRDSPGAWCELIKDIVAIANSGGGVILFGLDSRGRPSGNGVDAILTIDPADIGNRISKYTGVADLEFEFRELQKANCKLPALVIQPAPVPLVFEKPGTYDIGSGKQRTAFGTGTIYFRHGAKSEPASSHDLRLFVQRHLEFIRKSWLKGVRKVIQAPPGSHVITVRPGLGTGPRSMITRSVRAVNDPTATPVLLTRDAGKAEGTFVHEEVSEGIFDEINNVVDANRALAKGGPRFLLQPSVYYRIYGERDRVVQNPDNTGMLFQSATTMYAPLLFWTLSLPDKLVASTLAKLYVHPQNPQAHSGIRIALLLGAGFCDWLDDKWTRKWKRHPQPPSFYWSFREAKSKVPMNDPRLLAARLPATGQIVVPDEPATRATDLLNDSKHASSILSKVCLGIFAGRSDLRSVARSLDYIAYGSDVQERAIGISKAVVEVVGSQEVSDVGDIAETEGSL